MPKNNKQQILEGSRAVALTIKNINPAVVSAYPITPQTHIVEDLAKFKSEGAADYEYVRAESEFSAASIVAGASAAGVRTYTATSSQGLLLMTEVLFNIAGMRLPIVITCANRAISAPINIWNDQQDAVTIRDAGWIMLFAENHQEAVAQHILAYKIAETIKLPVMVNVDGFILTHSYEPVEIPDAKTIKKFLPDYKPAKGEYLDVKNPITMGGVVFPAHYLEMRQQMHDDMMSCLELINKEYQEYQRIIAPEKSQIPNSKSQINNGLIEYYGPKNPKTVLIAMGSVVGTIKDAVDEKQNKSLLSKSPLSLFRRGAGGEVERGVGGELSGEVGVLKIKTFRPFPAEEVLKIIKTAGFVAVVDKSISIGAMGTLALEVKAAAQNKTKAKIQSFIVGLGGRDVTKEMIGKIISEVKGKDDGVKFMGK